MPLFGTRRQSQSNEDLEAFKQRVVTEANAVARRFGRPSAAQEFLRALELTDTITPAAQAATPAAPVTKTVTAEVDVTYEVTATVPERLADQIDGYSSQQIEDVLTRAFTVSKASTRPFDVPVEVWNAINVQPKGIVLASIDAE